jgi:DNA-binding YbaB/EbfC family protein
VKNFGDMMKQIQEMQTRMQDLQARLEQATATGQSGGGLVKITLNGKGALKAAAIDPTLLKPEEREILEDLIIAAHGDAKAKMENMIAEQMKELTGGLPLPPGFQLPL